MSIRVAPTRVPAVVTSSELPPDGESAAPGEAGLLSSGLVVAVMTGLSRVTGLARDIAIANVFGASGSADAFFVAFRIPNLFRRMFAEGAFAQGFVPVLTEYRLRRPAEVRDLIDHVAGALGSALLVLTAIGMLAAPLIVWLVAPGFDAADPRRALTVDLLRLTFPYLLFISMVALAAGVQNTWQRFALPAATPVLLNLALITSVWFAAYAQPAVLALGWGVVAAGVLQLLLQVPALVRLGLLPRPRLDMRHPGVRRVTLLMLPAMLGASVSQVNLLIDTLLASFLKSGSISWLYYADRLMELPVGLVAVALGTVVLPALSARHAESSPERFSSTLDWGLRCALLLALPAALALTLLAVPLIATLFSHGALQPDDVRQASVALQAYALGVPGFVAVKVLAPGFFARQDTNTPVRIGIVAVIVNISLNLALISWLAHVGLALATSIAALVNALLLLLMLRRDGVYHPGRQWLRTGGGIVVGCVGMTVVVLALRGPDDWWLQATLAARVVWMAVLSVAGLAAFGGGALLGGLRPAHVRSPPATTL